MVDMLSMQPQRYNRVHIFHHYVLSLRIDIVPYNYLYDLILFIGFYWMHTLTIKINTHYKSKRDFLFGFVYSFLSFSISSSVNEPICKECLFLKISDILILDLFSPIVYISASSIITNRTNRLFICTFWNWFFIYPE
jgi:hypothetical protein